MVAVVYHRRRRVAVAVTIIWRDDFNRPALRPRNLGLSRDPGPTERLNGAAEAAGGGAAGLNHVDLGRDPLVVEIGDMSEAGIRVRVWEVGLGFWSPKRPGGGVVGAGGLLGGVEGAEPDASLLPGVSDLGGKSTPRTLPYASESYFLDRRFRFRNGDRRMLLLLINCGFSSSPHEVGRSGNMADRPQKEGRNKKKRESEMVDQS